MKNVKVLSSKEKAERLVEAVLKHLATIPGFTEEFADLGDVVQMNIRKTLERIVLKETDGFIFANVAQSITKQILADLTHRPGLRQGFFDAMESEDRGNLVKQILSIVVRNR